MSKDVQNHHLIASVIVCAFLFVLYKQAARFAFVCQLDNDTKLKHAMPHRIISHEFSKLETMNAFADLIAELDSQFPEQPPPNPAEPDADTAEPDNQQQQVHGSNVWEASSWASWSWQSSWDPWRDAHLPAEELLGSAMPIGVMSTNESSAGPAVGNLKPVEPKKMPPWRSTSSASTPAPMPEAPAHASSSSSTAAAPSVTHRHPPPPAPPTKDDSTEKKTSSRSERWRPRGGTKTTWYSVYHAAKKAGCTEEVAKKAADTASKK